MKISEKTINIKNEMNDENRELKLTIANLEGNKQEYDIKYNNLFNDFEQYKLNNNENITKSNFGLNN